MFYLNALTRLREHIAYLKHACGTARRNRRASRLYDRVTLALTDRSRNAIILKVETSPTTAAPVRFAHFLENVMGIGAEKRSGLGRYPKGFFQMTGIVIAKEGLFPLIGGSCCEYASPVHQKL